MSTRLRLGVGGVVLTALAAGYLSLGLPSFGQDRDVTRKLLASFPQTSLVDVVGQNATQRTRGEFDWTTTKHLFVLSVSLNRVLPRLTPWPIMSVAIR